MVKMSLHGKTTSRNSLFITIGLCISTPWYKMLHSIPEYLMLEKNSWGCLVQPQAGPANADCSENPDCFWTPPRMENPSPPWATCASLWLPSQGKIFPAVDQCVPMASGPGTRHHWEEPGSLFSSPSLQVLVGIDEPSLSLLFHRMNTPGSLVFLTGEVL